MASSSGPDPTAVYRSTQMANSVGPDQTAPLSVYTDGKQSRL